MQEPADWNDIEGWDRFHAETPVADRIAAARRALRYAIDLEANRLKRVWFPGCGSSLAPRSYAELGFETVASDLSREALDIQWRSLRAHIELLKMLYEQAVSGLAPERGGKLEIVKHDICTPFERPAVDCVLNIRAFTGFEHEAMRMIAASHVAALRPGGWVIFEMTDVALDARDAIEDLLIEAGATLPQNECERWYRRALRETGLPVTFILGHPRVDSAQGHLEQPGDQERLDEVEQAYLQRRRQQRAREGSPPEGAKLAFFLYD
ncbi:MAG TPA: methyltransferase domain-containing protein [Polyangiaceae bacterium]|nr:methyltransferase domain-containing protein [Polyangiaceae bacterium]